MRARLTIAACLVWSPAVLAEPYRASFAHEGVTAEVTIAESSPTVVDLIELRARVLADGPYAASSPRWQESLPEELEIAEIDTPRSSGAPGEVARWAVTLTPLAPGEYTIAPIEFTVTPIDGGDPILVRTEEITVTVRSILGADDDALAEIKGPVGPPPDYVKIAAIAGAGAAGLAVLIAAGVYAMKRRGREPAVPPIPPHESALVELDALLATDLIASAQWKRYFGELSSVLRRYIEGRFNLHAPTQTTEEFLRDPRTSTMFSADHDVLLRAFLGRADAVKFAEGATNAAAANEAADDVRRFVVDTAPAEGSA